MLLLSFVVQIAVMLAAPVALWLVLRRKLGAPWRLILIGALTFVLSQAVHIPLNFGLTELFQFEWMPKPPEAWQVPFNAVVLGLTAGLCEETARWIAYTRVVREARSFPQAVVLGAGHGGIESLLLGLLALSQVLGMAAQRGVTEADLVGLGLTSEQAATAVRQIAVFWATPVYVPLFGAVERLMAMLLHVTLSALVLLAVVRRRTWLFIAAIGWHATVDAVAVLAMKWWGVGAAEGLLAAMSVASLGILWACRKATPPAEVSAEEKAP